MTAYVSIPNGDVDPESPITTSLMVAMRDNPTAITEGSTGAPKIQTAALETTGGSEAVTQDTIRASAVGQGELKTTSGTVSVAADIGLLTLPGGEYGFFIQTRTSSTVNVENLAAAQSPIDTTGAQYPQQLSTSYITQIHLGIRNAGAVTMNAQQRYIQASPPYNLGNGDVPLFLFAAVDKLGKILFTYVAEDPPWANNGPTNIRADFKRNGKGYQRHIELPDGTTISSKSPALRRIENPRINRKGDRDQWIEAIRNPKIRDVEVTQEIKNADMGLIPHPFLGNNLTDITIVMIDPVGSITDELHILHGAGEDISGILRNNLRISNSQISGVASPPGVMPITANWK